MEREERGSENWVEDEENDTENEENVIFDPEIEDMLEPEDHYNIMEKPNFRVEEQLNGRDRHFKELMKDARLKNLDPKIRVNLSIPYDKRVLAMKRRFVLSHLLSFAIDFKLAEEGEREYPKCKLLDSVEKLRSLAESLSRKITAYEEIFKRNGFSLDEIRKMAENNFFDSSEEDRTLTKLNEVYENGFVGEASEEFGRNEETSTTTETTTDNNISDITATDDATGEPDDEAIFAGFREY